MAWENSCIAVCDDHFQAEKALYLLRKKGFDTHKLSIVGKVFQCKKHLLAVSEKTVAMNGFSALGEELYRIAIPEDSIIRYEAAIGSGCCLFIVQGDQTEVEQAHDWLVEGGARDITIHFGC